MTKKWVERVVRRIKAAVAYLISNAVGAGFGLLIEVGFMHMSFKQWIMMRANLPFKTVLGLIFQEKLTDFMRWLFFGNRKDITRFEKMLPDGLALVMFQVPIYAIVAWLVGATWPQVLGIAALYVVDGMIMGGLYGFVLDWVRSTDFFDRKLIQAQEFVIAETFAFRGIIVDDKK